MYDITFVYMFLYVWLQSTDVRIPISGEGLPSTLSLSSQDIVFQECVVGQVVEERLKIVNGSSFALNCILTVNSLLSETSTCRDPTTVHI